MADFRNDNDKLIGSAPEDVTKKVMGTAKDPVESIPMDERMPVKAMPQGADPKPFVLTGTPSGSR